MKIDFNIINRDDPCALHRQLKDLFVDAIRRGVYKPGEKIESQRELIKQSGLSYPTISHALQDLVKEGYIYRKIGSGSFVQSSIPGIVPKGGKIGVFYFSTETPLFLSIFEGIRKAAFPKHLEPVPLAIGTTVTTENKALIEASKDEYIGIMGLPVYSYQMHRTLLKIMGSGKPVIFLNSILPKYPADVILFDNFYNGYKIARHLIELGHQRFALIRTFVPHPHDRIFWEFRQGVQFALSELGLSLKSSMEFFLPFLFDDRDPAFLQDFIETYEEESPGQRPSAIICEGDGMACYVIASLKKQGISVPRDISVTGAGGVIKTFGDNKTLTTIDWPTEAFGQKAVHLLLERLSFPELPQTRIILESKLSIGNTTDIPPR